MEMEIHFSLDLSLKLQEESDSYSFNQIRWLRAFEIPESFLTIFEIFVTLPG